MAESVLQCSYLLTPWSRILPEKLKRPKLLNKFPASYGTRKFITALTRARHLSLSCTEGLVWFRGIVWSFVTWLVFYGKQLSAPRPTWRTTPCRLSSTAYSIYSQLPPYLEAVPPSATWGRAMSWWQHRTHWTFTRAKNCMLLLC